MRHLYFDYGHPLVFLGLLILFSYLGFHESVFSIGALLGILAWFLWASWALNKLAQRNADFTDAGAFFTLMLIFTFTGLFIESYLNAETFLVLFLFTIFAERTYHWLLNNPVADARLYYLMTGQCLAAVFIVPILLNYANMDLLQAVKHAMASAHAAAGAGGHGAPAVAVTHGKEAPLFVLNFFEVVVIVISLLLARMGYRAGCRNHEREAAQSIKVDEIAVVS